MTQEELEDITEIVCEYLRDMGIIECAMHAEAITRKIEFWFFGPQKPEQDISQNEFNETTLSIFQRQNAEILAITRLLIEKRIFTLAEYRAMFLNSTSFIDQFNAELRDEEDGI